MDRISELPDCVLTYILSMLPIKDLLKTSVLSTRWWNLWLLRRDLNFDIVNMFGSNEKTPAKYERVLIDLKRTEFVQRVNQFIQKFNTTKIDSLRVAYYLTTGQSSSIDRWISFAITRGVERIDLRFKGYDGVTSAQEPYVFPLLILSKSGASTLKHMHMQSCILPNPPANFSAVPFRNLRSLVLDHVHVSQDLITSLLSECVLLEELFAGFSSDACRTDG
ncbi:hypothetical protein RIF29_29749 [Crotalaria pallida]|uniref:F-box domain-containing protein n=1 Tax=Crotalaria pallida TaxID=3830 RepID=A0AAN9ELX4_CROPI